MSLREFVERDYQWHHTYPRRGWSHGDWTLLTLRSHGCDICHLKVKPLLHRVDRWVCVKCSGLGVESLAEFAETHEVDP